MIWADKVYQCPTKGGTVPCGAAGHWVAMVFMSACALVGLVALVVEVWSWFNGRRR